jgi:hypothetical protein
VSVVALTRKNLMVDADALRELASDHRTAAGPPQEPRKRGLSNPAGPGRLSCPTLDGQPYGGVLYSHVLDSREGPAADLLL